MKRAVKDDIVQVIKKLNLNSGDVDKISASEPLRDQGIDSLDMMNIFFELEEKFKIKISDEMLEDKDWSTIDSIIENVNQLMPS